MQQIAVCSDAGTHSIRSCTSCTSVAAAAAALCCVAGFAPSVLADGPACLEREELSFIMIKPGALLCIADELNRLLWGARSTAVMYAR
jgi:hypothetical protein